MASESLFLLYSFQGNINLPMVTQDLLLGLGGSFICVLGFPLAHHYRSVLAWGP
jgi:hypothetical protein